MKNFSFSCSNPECNNHWTRRDDQEGLASCPKCGAVSPDRPEIYRGLVWRGGFLRTA